MKTDQQIAVPAQTDPAALELITRAWAEGNISGSGGGWAVSTVIPVGLIVTVLATEQLIRYGNFTIEGDLILDGELVIL